MLTAYRRHLSKCKHRSRKYKSCFCPIWVQGTLDGRSVRKSLDLTSWEAAQRKIRDLEIHGESRTVTVDEACTRWITDCEVRGLKEETLRKYRARTAELTEKFGSISVRSITLDDLRKLRESWEVQASSMRKRVEILRGFFAFCVSSEWIAANPAKQLKPPVGGEKAKLPFSKTEVEKIMWALDTYSEIYPTTAPHTLLRLRAMVLLMRHSGLRISDVVSLRAEKISSGKVFLRQAKSEKPVWLPLPKNVVKALAACDLGDGRFFWDEGGKIKTTITEWQVRLKKMFTIAGIADGHGHRFRHTLAKDLLERGVPLEMVAAILGNTVKVCEKHYSHWVQSRQNALEEAVKKTWA